MTITVTDAPAPNPARPISSRNWRFELYESNLTDDAPHPLTGMPTPGLHTRVCSLTDASDKHIDFLLNRSGQMTFKLPVMSDQAKQIVGYEVIRAVVAYCDDATGVPRPRWSGFIGPVEQSADGGANDYLSVTCWGWFELLHSRELRYTASFYKIDAGVIATRLLGYANNQIANNNVVTGTSPTLNAEDLLYGVGDGESIATITTTDSWATPPAPSTDWAVSCASSIRAVSSATGALAAKRWYYLVPGPVGTASGYTQVDASDTYQLRFVANTAITGGYFRSAVRWYDATSVFLSTTYGASITTSVNAQVQVDNHVAPASAAYAQVGFEYTLTGAGANSVDAAVDACYFSKNSVGVVATPISAGTIASPANPAGADRIRTYQPGQKIGQAIEELSNIEAGFDFAVEVVEATVLGGDTLLRKLNIYYDIVKGTIYGRGTDRVNTVWGFGIGPCNLVSIRERRDVSRLADRVNARGTNASGTVQDLGAISKYGLWEDSTSLSDAGTGDSVYRDFAGAEVAFRAAPVTTYAFNPMAWDGDFSNRQHPLPFVDFDLGDICYLVADYGSIQIPADINEGGTNMQPVRIFGFSVDIDNEGNELVSNFQTTASQ